MSLIWHIVWKDLRRLRWILLLWGVVVAGHLALADVQAKLDAEGAVTFYWAAWVFGAVFVPAVTLGLVMGLQGDDPVCDSDAFWVTRPIARRQLFAAKSCGLILFWILPLIVTTPWWLSHGYEGRQIARASLRLVEAQAIITLLAMPLALISASGSRFVMYLMLTLALFFVPTGIHAMSDVRWSDRPSVDTADSRDLVAAAIWLSATAVIAVMQYRRRWTRGSMILLLTSTLAVGSVLTWWTWDFLPRPLRPDERVSAKVLSFQIQSVAPDRGPTPTSPADQAVTVVMKIGGLQEGTAPGAVSVSHHLQWRDDTISPDLASPPGDGLLAPSLAVALGKTGENILRSDFRLPAGKYESRLRSEPPRYSVDISGEIYRLDVVAELPAEIDARSVQQGASVRVEYFALTDPRGLVIPLSESAPDFSPGWLEWGFGSPNRSFGLEYYFLVNRGDGRAILAQATGAGENAVIATIGYFRSTLVFSKAEIARAGIPDLRSWLKSARLVKVATRRVGPFQGAAEMARFEFLNPPAPAGP